MCFPSSTILVSTCLKLFQCQIWVVMDTIQKWPSNGLCFCWTLPINETTYSYFWPTMATNIIHKFLGSNGKKKTLNTRIPPLKYCWWTKSCTTEDDDYPIIYKVLAPSQVVVWDFFHQQYHFCVHHPSTEKTRRIFSPRKWRSHLCLLQGPRGQLIRSMKNGTDLGSHVKPSHVKPSFLGVITHVLEV